LIEQKRELIVLITPHIMTTDTPIDRAATLRPKSE
jgi:hypothetical protein